MKKIYIFKHNPNPNLNLSPFPHSFGPGTFALNSHTYKPLFEKILDPPLSFIIYLDKIALNLSLKHVFRSCLGATLEKKGMFLRHLCVHFTF